MAKIIQKNISEYPSFSQTNKNGFLIFFLMCLYLKFRFL